MVLFELSIIFFGLLFLIPLSYRQLYEYERGIVFTLGRYSRQMDPGPNFIIPFIEEVRKVDMRLKTLDIPKQEVMTRDNIPIMVNAVIYFRVEKPLDVLLKIEDYIFAVSQYTQTALRDVVGDSELDKVLTERENVADAIKKIVDSETSTWGVDISSIKIQEMEIPADMKRALAKQAEAERDKRANIIISEGELAASENLRKASENLSKSPAAVHLRTLQTISGIAGDPSEKINWIIPMELITALQKIAEKK
ncbi:MAG: SPFH domain-containing protein [Candidatus Micrarchaeia archaeon]|jgi:regulator of protease activity HflC (stomatin/prohibitin superfamily)